MPRSYSTSIPPQPSLRVTNIHPYMDSAWFRALFESFGEIRFFSRISPYFCAFVNFRCTGDAVRARAALQGYRYNMFALPMEIVFARPPLEPEDEESRLRRIYDGIMSARNKNSNPSSTISAAASLAASYAGTPFRTPADSRSDNAAASPTAPPAAPAEPYDTALEEIQLSENHNSTVELLDELKSLGFSGMLAFILDERTWMPNKGCRE